MTQARMLAGRLRALGREVVETREPGGAPGAEEIRRLQMGDKRMKRSLVIHVPHASTLCAPWSLMLNQTRLGTSHPAAVRCTVERPNRECRIA